MQMRRLLYIGMLMVLIAPQFANAASILRIKCHGSDEGEEIFLNNKFVGNCPLDVPAQAGVVNVLGKKMIDSDHERMFEKKITVVEGVPQRIEIILSEPRLTVEGERRLARREATAQLSLAEAGDHEAMKKIAKYYFEGYGVEANIQKAKYWNQKAEEGAARLQLQAAERGDVVAMKEMAVRYTAGAGVEKDSAKAQMWRKKANATELAQAESLKAQEKQKKLDNVRYFEHTFDNIGDLVGSGEPDAFGFSSVMTSILPASTFGLITDAVSAPFKTTEIQAIQNEAALRPSTWGKPDSMMAKAAQQRRMSQASNAHDMMIALK
jgi:hypothetical protein